MSKNRTIAIAIPALLLTLARVDAAPAATPLTSVRVAAKLANTQNPNHAPGDFDRAFIVRQTGEGSNQKLQARNASGPVQQGRNQLANQSD